MTKLTGYILPIEEANSVVVGTREAAFYLGRQPNTLRMWASNENGPIRPIKINGRLAWKLAEIKQILSVTDEI